MRCTARVPSWRCARPGEKHTDYRERCPKGRRKRPSRWPGKGNASWCWPRATPSITASAVRLPPLRKPGDDLAYHPGITAFQALFCHLGLPWQDARLFCVHSGEGLPSRRHSRSAAVRNLCGEPLPGARHRPRRARRASRIGPTRRDHRRTHRLGRRTHPVRDSGRAGRRRLRPDVHPRHLSGRPMPIAMLRTRPPQRGAAPPFRPRYWHWGFRKKPSSAKTT